MTYVERQKLDEKEDDGSEIYVHTMAFSDYCHLCKTNMWVEGIYGHTEDMFLSKRTQCLYEKSRARQHGYTQASTPLFCDWFPR